MSLYTIGDLHLSFSTDKPMDIFGRRWKNYVAKIEKNWKKKITSKDTIVLTGDHSWGRNLDEAQKDLNFIINLPGRKILLRGNHDMFWDAKKTQKLNDLFQGKLEFLQNNFYSYQDYALVGTKGYCYEGKDSIEHFLKLRTREIERLRVSFETARTAGYDQFIMFLHYPPIFGQQVIPEFFDAMKEYGVKQCFYGHLHGGAIPLAYQGEFFGVDCRLISADYLKFCPIKIR